MLLLFYGVSRMLNFYDVKESYAQYLRAFEHRIPNIHYASNNKFVCGIVLSVNGFDYFAPISSNTAKQRTSLLILDERGKAISSIKFSFMFPIPVSEIVRKDFAAIRKENPHYADVLTKEYRFCVKNEDAILQKAEQIYRIGCNRAHWLAENCCDYKLLESKYVEWIQKSEHTANDAFASQS